MKAQTARTPQRRPGASDQVTPVIIKFAGGESTGDATFAPAEQVLSVNSDFMPFDDPSGPVWEKAKSTSSGRVHELTLRDGGLPSLFCTVTPRLDAATSLELDYKIGAGKEVLTIQETEDSGLFSLEITSNRVPFTVTEAAAGAGWLESQARFSGSLKRVVFKQTDIKTGEVYFALEYTVNSSDVALNLDFLVDPIETITE